jgi:flagellar basal body P-ring protein FlgI
MTKHGFGMSNIPGMKRLTPEVILADPNFAIVQVDGYLPPGVRQGQAFDVQVSALPESATTSLAGANLFRADLRVQGANPRDPGGSVNVYAWSEGPVFVNPVYALGHKADDAAAKRSLRFGIVMGGGTSQEDRAISLRLIQPQAAMARAIERRIDQRFQKQADRLKPSNVPGLAEAQDEGVVNFYVPESYHGDWERYVGVVQYLYMYDSPEFNTNKALELADEAVKER